MPCLNEEGSVAGVIDDLRRERAGLRRARDRRRLHRRHGEVARDAGAAVLSHPFNLGIGGAVQSGYRYALS